MWRSCTMAAIAVAAITRNVPADAARLQASSDIGSPSLADLDERAVCGAGMDEGDEVAARAAPRPFVDETRALGLEPCEFRFDVGHPVRDVMELRRLVAQEADER